MLNIPFDLDCKV